MKQSRQRAMRDDLRAAPGEPSAKQVTAAEAEHQLRTQVFGAGEAKRSPQKERFVDSVVAGLPQEMTMQARRHVGEVAFAISQTPTVQRVTKSRRSDLLKKIAMSARALDELHAELYRDHQVEATDIVPAQLARRRLKGELLASEAEDAERGLTRDGLSNVLAGVAAHMAAIEDVHPAQRKRPPLPHGRVLRSVLFDAYIASGLPPPDRDAFSVQLQHLLEVAGLERTSVKKLVDEMSEFKPATP